MAKEIERKFPARDGSRRAAAERRTYLRDGFIIQQDGMKLRVRFSDGHANLTFKGPRRGISRDEFEYPIPAAQSRPALLAARHPALPQLHPDPRGQLHRRLPPGRGPRGPQPADLLFLGLHRLGQGAGPGQLRAGSVAQRHDRDLDRYDGLVPCGGLLRNLPAPSPRRQAHLRKAAVEGKPIVALCTGSFLLAQAGLLDGRRCAVHFDVLGEFARRFPKALPQSGSNYINDGNIITCPGSIVAIDVAAYLISRSGDPARADKSLNYLLIKPNDGVSPATCHRSAALSRASRLTVDAVRYMEFRLDSPCTIDEVAAVLNTTCTRLGRSFQRDLQMAPAAFWRDIRLEAACTLLGAARRSISEVAFDLGFCDSAHFCRAFKARWSMTPDKFRRGQRPAGTAEHGG